MDKITEAEARNDWSAELQRRGWESSKLARIMFLYDPDVDGRTRYAPAPAWRTVAATDGTADRNAYETLKRRLLAQGEPFSARGSRSGASLNRPLNLFEPIPIDREVVVLTIAKVMSEVCPAAVTQEQILRAAFVTRLPSEYAQSIGTSRSAVHLERATPSLYRHTGMTDSRARFDLGFGSVQDDSHIAGVVELKASSASYDRVRRPADICRTDTFENGTTRRRGEPLSVDFLKLLDPKLPTEAFRISWIALTGLGSMNPSSTLADAEAILCHAAARRGLSEPEWRCDSNGWMAAYWPLPGITLELAWYKCEASGCRFTALWS